MSTPPNPKGQSWHHRLRHFLEARGQALVEYVLILVLVIMALAVVLSISGPAVGNVFSNTVANLLDLTTTPEDPMTEGQFWQLVTAVASYTPDYVAIVTNTPPPDGDADSDGIRNSLDNCPTVPNSDQANNDPPGTDPNKGDVCDEGHDNFTLDNDKDGYYDRACTLPYASDPDQRKKCDNCLGVKNADQADADNDGEGNSCEPPTPTWTPSPGPSPTPTDQVFPYPFTDTGNKNNFQTNFRTLLKGQWDASYWTRNVTGCVEGSSPQFQMNTGAQATEKVNGLTFPISGHRWYDSGQKPSDTLTETNFCAKYTQSAYIAAGTYTWRVRIDPNNTTDSTPKGDRIRISVDGTAIYADWDGQTDIYYKNTPATLATELSDSGQASAKVNGEFIEFVWTAATTKDYSLQVEYVDRTSAAVMEVYLTEGGLVDQGSCAWESVDNDTDGGSNTITPPPGTTAFWSDSPGGQNYKSNSFCILRLRGSLDLDGSIYPFIEWYDQHSIEVGDTFWVAVKRTTDTEWYMKPIHSAKSSNFSWTKREVSLSTFDGYYENTNKVGSTRAVAPRQNFVGSEVEVAFILESDANNVRQGWFVAGFRAFEKVYTIYKFPFVDDFEGASNWVDLTGGDWETTSSAYSGGVAWDDRVGSNYQTNKDFALQLNGLLDMTDLNAVVDPEVAFWHKWDIASGTTLSVEISRDFGETWTGLRSTDADATPELYAGASENATWKLETIPLNITPSGADQDLAGERFMVRFRIKTGGTSAPGWTLDNVAFRNKPIVATIFPRWCDEFNTADSLSNWNPEGTWNLTTAATGLGSYSSPTAFTDSPTGNYLDGSDSYLTLNRLVNLSGTTDPILEFWHRWEINDTDWLKVEMYQEVTGTWDPIWDFYHNEAPARYHSSVTSGQSWEEQIAWQRVVVPLKTLIDVGNTDKEIKLRWRLDARSNSAVDDGWYIDNVCIKEFDDPVLNIPWEDDFEVINSNNWYRAEWNYWDLTSSVNPKSRSGNLVMETNPTTNYFHDSDSILELRGILNLTGAGLDDITLYYWENYDVSVNDRFYAEVQEVTMTGNPLTDWVPVSTILSDQRNVAWNRRQVDLNAYKNKYIRLRFRLQALNGDAGSPGTARGQMLDGLRIVDRTDEETALTLPLTERADTGATPWIREGDWSLTTDTRPLGSGSVLGPGLWSASYYRIPDWTQSPNFANAGSAGYELLGTEGVPEVDFNWGSTSAPILVMNDPTRPGRNDFFMVSYKRRVVFTRDTQMAIHVNSDDGHRLIIDNGNIIPDGNQWIDCGNCRTGEDPVSLTGTQYVHNFSPGTHDIEIQYYENSGGAKVESDFTLVSGGNTLNYDPFGATSWSGQYFKYCDESSITGTAWNSTPETLPLIDFNWASDNVPSPVQTNNTASVTPGGSAGAPAFRADATNRINIPAELAHTRTTVASRSWNDTSSSAFDGEVVRAMPDGGTTIDPLSPTTNPTNSPGLTYKVNFPLTGTWYVWVRGRGNDSSANSFYMGFNNTGITQVALSNNNTYGWTSRQSISVPSVGEHTFNIWMREDGATIDHIYMSRNSGDTPPSSAPALFTCNTGDPKEFWAARYEHTVTVTTTTKVTFNVTSDDGHRLYISESGGAFNLASGTDKWSDGDQTSTYTHTFPAGTHKLRLEYMNRYISNGADLNLSYILEGAVLHSDSNRTGSSPDFYGASLMLENEINLTSVTSAGMTWWDRYDVGNSDTLIVEINRVGGDDPAIGAASTWTRVYQRPGPHTSTTWQQRFIDLTPYAGDKIVVRFRIDALNNNDQRNGWFIDDIEINN